jgi:hypothetical protein
VLHAFWHSLALAGALGEGSPAAGDDGARNAMLASIREAQAGFETLAQHCAQNFRCQALLLAAEIARIEGRARDALAALEQAIEFAAGEPLIQHQALAHELAGRLRLRCVQPHLAALHFAQACDAYRQWGAFAKVRALEREHPVLAAGSESAAGAELLATSPASSLASTDPAETFDLFSVLKAAQAIAAEVERGALLTRLMHIAIENAGAERGALVLEGEAGPRVHSSDAAPPTREGVPLAACDAVPAGIVHYVRRTREPVVLAQAPEDEQHGGDPYVLRHAPRSVACLPLALGGGALGVLYLEHRRAGAVFTAGRLRTLQILAAQVRLAPSCPRPLLQRP